MITQKIYFTVIVFFITIIIIHAQTSTIKTSKYKYNSTSKTELVLNNNYGNINILNSKNDSILIEVRVNSIAGNKNKSNKILGKVNIKEEIDNNFISISTILKDKKENDNLHIDYIVRMPINTNLYIANKHGNVYIGDHHGKLNININYGKLEAKNLVFTESKPLSKLNFKYCDVNIESCNWAEINTSFTNLNIENSKSLIINSSYSVIKLEQNAVLKLSSNNDIYKINSISKISGTTKNTSTYAKNLTSSINLVGENGYFKIGYISSYFDNINLKYLNGDVSLLIDDKTSYKINCTVENGTLDIDQKDDIIKGSNFKTIEGLIGTNKDSKKTVNVKLTNGNIEF